MVNVFEKMCFKNALSEQNTIQLYYGYIHLRVKTSKCGT
jgi:hypothetical protein